MTIPFSQLLFLQNITFDLVLNLAESFGGTNKHEVLVPAMLEALEIPFTGASAHNMHLTLNKESTKVLTSHYGIPVPPHQIFRNAHDNLERPLRFPLIVKPIHEEASIGIHNESVVINLDELHRQVKTVLNKYGQPAIAEEFIEGKEISLGAIGNPPNITIFPSLEFEFPDASSVLEQIRSYEYKWGGKKEQMFRALLPPNVEAQLKQYTRLAYIITECRDYARMDYRLDKEGNIYLLEVNYNPGIGPNDHGLNNTLTMMASFVGFSFEDLIEQIVIIAGNRCGIVSATPQ